MDQSFLEAMQTHNTYIKITPISTTTDNNNECGSHHYGKPPYSPSLIEDPGDKHHLGHKFGAGVITGETHTVEADPPSGPKLWK